MVMQKEEYQQMREDSDQNVERNDINEPQVVHVRIV